MEIVNKIIEIDRMADKKINDAKKQSEDILLAAQKESVSLKKDIEAAAEKRIAEIESINKSDYDLQVAELERQHNIRKQQMDKSFESTHEAIENSIFAEIVGE